MQALNNNQPKFDKTHIIDSCIDVHNEACMQQHNSVNMETKQSHTHRDDVNVIVDAQHVLRTRMPKPQLTPSLHSSVELPITAMVRRGGPLEAWWHV